MAKEKDYNEQLLESQEEQRKALEDAAQAKADKVEAAKKAGPKDGKPAKLQKNEHWRDPDDHEAGVVEERDDVPDERETKSDPGGSPPDRT